MKVEEGGGDEVEQVIERMVRRVYSPEWVRVKDGVMEVIEKMGEKGILMLLGTIATKKWTDEKLDNSDLVGVFGDEEIMCFDVERPKEEQWGGMFEYYDLDPSKVWVVEDSLSSALAVLELECKVFWVKNSRMSDGDFEATEVPPGVVKILEVGEMKDYL